MRYVIRSTVLLTGILIACVAHRSSAVAQGVAEFYSNKTVRLVLAGGPATYGVLARLVIPYMERYLPGSPTIVTQNMVGGGGLKAANYVYNVMPQDGTGLGILLKSFAMAPLLRETSAKFDPTKFSIIGSSVETSSVIVVKKGIGIRNLLDARKREVILSAGGKVGPPSICASVTNAIVGTKFNVVLGYRGAERMLLAVENGEAEGACAAWNTMNTARPHWFTDGSIIPLLLLRQERDPQHPQVPVLTEFAKTDDDRKFVGFISADTVLGRPFVATPNVPRDRLKALRFAFAKSMQDPALLEIAKKRKMKMDFVDWRTAEEAVRKIYTADEKHVARLRRMLGLAPAR